MSLTKTLKIGMHRNSPRLWIEGALLKAAGFKRGDRYRIAQAAPDTFVVFAECDAVVLESNKTLHEDDFPTIKRGIISGRSRRGKEILILDCHSKLFTAGLVTVVTAQKTVGTVRIRLLTITCNGSEVSAC